MKLKFTLFVAIGLIFLNLFKLALDESGYLLDVVRYLTFVYGCFVGTYFGFMSAQPVPKKDEASIG